MDLFDQLITESAEESGSSVPGRATHVPLAEQLRPRTLDAFVGQRDLLAEGKILRVLLQRDQLPSMIFWGPPGSGKTTLARLIAAKTSSAFREFSAVSSGLADIRKVVEEAKARMLIHQQRTMVFIDEIHRFNKTQQDAFLPHVEAGTFTLIGATTENPSFSVNGALLSRSRVLILREHSIDDLSKILDQALAHLANMGLLITLDDATRLALLQSADGDARRLLTTVEVGSELLRGSSTMLFTEQTLREALQHKHLLYDKAGEEHYNLISALHKSLRDSDPDGSVYWLGRMLEAGEDPLFLARRLTRAAAEDIGLADPQALILASAAFIACERLGMPECSVILAELAIYLALAPKSNAVYVAYTNVREDVERTANNPVPLHLRNASTTLMKNAGYGHGYQYAHDAPNAIVNQQHLPDSLKDKTYYHPTTRGQEGKTSS